MKLKRKTEYAAGRMEKGLRKRGGAFMRFGALSAALLMLSACAGGNTGSAQAEFERGVNAYNACEMDEAKRAFAESCRLDGGIYPDVKQYLDAIAEYEKLYSQGVSAYEKGDLASAESAFLGIKNFLNSEDYLTSIDSAEAEYEKAVALYESGDYIKAYEAFVRLGGYQHSEEYAANIHSMIALYNEGVQLMNRRSYSYAIRAFRAINTSFLDSEDLIAACETKLCDETVKLGEYINNYNAEYSEGVSIVSGSSGVLFSLKDSRGVIFSGAMDESGIVRYLSFYITDRVRNELGSEETESTFAHCIHALNPAFSEYAAIRSELSEYFRENGKAYGCMRVHVGEAEHGGTVLTAEYEP